MDNFNFDIISDFPGYNSSQERTNLKAGYLVRGSQNVYRRHSGTIASRPGLKLRGVIDSTDAGVVAEFVYNTSQGRTLPLRVCNNKLQVEFELVWYDLVETSTLASPAATLTRFVFSPWWEVDEQKDRLVMVRGDTNALHWSGGIARIASATVDTITKSGTETWEGLGFASSIAAEKKIVISGVEYTYTGGSDTTTLTGVTPDPSAIVADTIAIQPVFVQTLVDEIADDDFVADFLAVIGNQMCYGSYTSKIIHISNDVTSGGRVGFSNLLNTANDQVIGEADFAVLDDVANGMITRNGKLYVSAGSSDWYEVSPNTVPPVAIPFYHDVPASSEAYVITEVKKRKGSGLAGLLAHEFACIVGDNIFYVSKDNQLRVVGTFTQIEGTNFPVVSQSIYKELQDEDFTDGHIKSSGDTVYITAPTSGRHWMYQIKEDVDGVGQITAQRTWQPPQVAGISRFSEIDGILYGHSNHFPQLYQIWDTNQWHDDDPSEEDISYTCVARFSYMHTPTSKGGIDRVGLSKFDRIYYEGLIANGSILYGKAYLDYKGATDIQDFEINTIDSPATFFLGGQVSGIGTDSLGVNPLGDGIVEESSDQATLSKFRAICQAVPKDAFEYELEVYSVDLESRWELIALGVNLASSENNPTFIGK